MVAILILLLHAEYSYQKRVWFLTRASHEGSAETTAGRWWASLAHFEETDLTNLQNMSKVARSQKIYG